MTIRPPEPDEIPGLIRMLTRSYVANRPGFPDDPALIAAYSEHDPGGGADNWVVMWDGDRAVSALRLFLRDVSTPGGTLRIGGIGNVGTAPECGGRGLATRVMDAAHAKLRRMGIPTAVLVTDIPAFYERMGYRFVHQRELLGICQLSTHAVPDSSFQSTRLTSPIPATLRQWHADSARVTVGRVERSVEYWESWIARFKLLRQDVEGFFTEGAYVIGRSEEDGEAYRVLEGAGEERRLMTLIAHHGNGATRLKTPDEPIYRRIMAALGAEISERTRTGIMALSLSEGAPGSTALEGFLELDAF